MNQLTGPALLSFSQSTLAGPVCFYLHEPSPDLQPSDAPARGEPGSQQQQDLHLTFNDTENCVMSGGTDRNRGTVNSLRGPKSLIPSHAQEVHDVGKVAASSLAG